MRGTSSWTCESPVSLISAGVMLKRADLDLALLQKCGKRLM